MVGKSIENRSPIERTQWGAANGFPFLDVNYNTPLSKESIAWKFRGLSPKFSHIVGKHEGSIDGAVDVILTGTAYKHDKSRRKVYIIKDRPAIVLSKDREGRLLLTDFENITDKQFADYTSKGKYHARGGNK